jgi:shikimate kinase
MEGRAKAPAAGTVLNALAAGFGSAFAIDRYVTAEVHLGDATQFTGAVTGAPATDTALIERCVELTVERVGRSSVEGGHVQTESDVPAAGGLKSSSAAANATVLATLAALGEPVGRTERLTREAACRIGVTAARETGVTVTGAFDDASASMLGGVTITENPADRLLAREAVEWDVLVLVPDDQAFSADADIGRCERLAGVSETVLELATEGAYGRAMTINGLAYCAALEFSPEPIVEALPHARGVSLSGTGPSYVAIGERDRLRGAQREWDTREGVTWLTTTQTKGAQTY